MSRGIAVVLADARRGLDRLSLAEAFRAQSQGAVLVDIRPDSDRRAEGAIPGALVVDIEGGYRAWRAAGLPTELRTHEGRPTTVTDELPADNEG